MDGSGNVYFSDSVLNVVEEWNAATQQVNTLVSGLNNPSGVAVDRPGNVYFADSCNQAIKESSLGSDRSLCNIRLPPSAPVVLRVETGGANDGTPLRIHVYVSTQPTDAGFRQPCFEGYRRTEAFGGTPTCRSSQATAFDPVREAGARTG